MIDEDLNEGSSSLPNIVATKAPIGFSSLWDEASATYGAFTYLHRQVCGLPRSVCTSLLILVSTEIPWSLGTYLGKLMLMRPLIMANTYILFSLFTILPSYLGRCREGGDYYTFDVP